MPEGDTLHRSARTLNRWLSGRTVTSVQCAFTAVPIESVVGSTIERVEARGKHLLMHCSSGAVLRTHLGIEGSWHVSPAGEGWTKPAWRMRVAIEAGDRAAVCFDAPEVEVLSERELATHPALSSLGPDLLGEEVDYSEIVRRFRTLDASEPIGEALLDQRVLAGIGNIYRAEALFAAKVHPHAAVGDLDDNRLVELAEIAARLLRAGVDGPVSRETGLGPGRRWVYGRAGKPCRRCGTKINAEMLGEKARRVFWCPECQRASSPP